MTHNIFQKRYRQRPPWSAPKSTKLESTERNQHKIRTNDPLTLDNNKPRISPDKAEVLDVSWARSTEVLESLLEKSVRVNRRLSTSDVIVFGFRQRGHCARAVVKSDARAATWTFRLCVLIFDFVYYFFGVCEFVLKMRRRSWPKRAACGDSGE